MRKPGNDCNYILTVYQTAYEAQIVDAISGDPQVMRGAVSAMGVEPQCLKAEEIKMLEECAPRALAMAREAFNLD